MTNDVLFFSSPLSMLSSFFLRVRLHPLFIPFSFVFVLGAAGAATNRTIDDTLGDPITGTRPIYLPATKGVWEDATCKSCVIQPAAAQAFNGTWTAATYNKDLKNVSIELDFKGTALYVFFILANDEGDGITTRTECNFTLDGQPAGNFLHLPSTSTALQYNALVFSKISLPNTDHRFLISTSGVDHDVFVNFDYAIYTFEDQPTTTSSTHTTRPASSTRSTVKPTRTSKADNTTDGGSPSTNVGAIAGGIVGGFAALLILILAVVFCYRRRNKTDAEHAITIPSWVGGRGSANPADPQYTITPYQDHPSSTTALSGSDTPDRSTTYGDRPSMYGSRNVISALPSGEVMMSAYVPSSDGHESSSAAQTERAMVARTLSVRTTPTDEVRRARQAEIERQMEALHTEMNVLSQDLKATAQNRPLPSIPQERSDDAEKAAMREQIRTLQDQIQYLQSQQMSPWAQGLTDEPPPGYTPRSPSIRRT